MLDKELYKNTFSVLKASEDTLSEVMKMTTHRKRIISKVLLIAATVAILAVALVGTAFAANMFGIRDLLVQKSDSIVTFDDFPGTEEQYKVMNPDGTLGNFTVPTGNLLLSGFAGRPEFDAVMEWLNRDSVAYVDIDGVSVGVRWDWEAEGFVNSETGEFVTKGIMVVDSQKTLDSLTPEELEDYIVILRSDLDEIPEVYRWYGVLSWGDVEKINEIVDRHGLVLYGEHFDYYSNNRSWDEFQASVANGQFVDNSGANFTLYPGYRWESGTFKFDAKYDGIEFSLRSSRKGTFDTVMITNIDINSFTDEWAYENVHGTNLLLVQSSNQSFIIADTETAFIVVSLGAETATGTDLNRATLHITRSELENFADMIDFRQLK